MKSLILELSPRKARKEQIQPYFKSTKAHQILARLHPLSCSFKQMAGNAFASARAPSLTDGAGQSWTASYTSKRLFAVLQFTFRNSNQTNHSVIHRVIALQRPEVVLGAMNGTVFDQHISVRDSGPGVTPQVVQVPLSQKTLLLQVQQQPFPQLSHILSFLPNSLFKRCFLAE